MSNYKNWYKIEIRELGGIIASGDNSPNIKEFMAQYKSMIKWCKENFDKKRFKIFVIDDGWHTDAYLVGYVFYFKYKIDVMAFKLRWI